MKSLSKIRDKTRSWIKTGFLLLSFLGLTGQSIGFPFWLDGPSGRSNCRDPKSPCYQPKRHASATPVTYLDAYDPADDLSSGATPLTITGALQSTIPGDHVVGGTGDSVDLFRVVLEAGHVYLFSAVRESGASPFTLEILNSTLAPAAPGVTHPAAPTYAGFVAPADGVFYLAVRSSEPVLYHLMYRELPQPATATPLPTDTALPTNTPLPTNTSVPPATQTASPTVTVSPTPQPSESASPAATASPTRSRTLTPAPSISRTATPTPTPSTSSTVTASATHFDSATTTASLTASPSSTFSLTATPSRSPSTTVSLTGSATATRTATPTVSSTVTLTGSPTSTGSATPTTTPSATVTATSTITLTLTAVPTGSSATPSPTISNTATHSATPSHSPSSTRTATRSVTTTRSSTPTFDQTATPTRSATPSASPTVSRTSTTTRTSSPTASSTASRSATPTRTVTSTATPSAARTATSSQTVTVTPSSTLSGTPSGTRSATSTPTHTRTSTRTSTATPSATPSRTSTPVNTFTRTATPTFTRTFTLTYTYTHTPIPTATNTPVTVPCAEGLVLDGAVNESLWTGIAWTDVTNCVNGTCGSTARFKAAYDPTYLYIAVDVNDSALFNDSANIWEDDSVEFYFDVNNNHSATYQADDFHYNVGYQGGEISGEGKPTTGVIALSQLKSGGYTMEFAVPWTTLGITPSEGRVIGFDLGVNDDQDGGTREGQLMWQGTDQNYLDTSAWGDLSPLGTACPFWTPTPTSTPAPFTPTFTSSPTPSRGASVPWDEFEAESLATNAAVLGPSRTLHTVEAESSGRGAVRLNSTGHYVQTAPTPRDYNAIVIRFSMPDAGGGGGINATLSLYINDVHTADFNLTSRYAWAYGGFNIPYNQNPGGGSPLHFYDEARMLLPSTIPAGSTVKLQKDSDDTASYYVIDLIDLEMVGAPIAQPGNSLSAADYGAVPNDAGDDTAALQSLINAAQSQGRVAYIPAGTYQISNYLTLPAVAVQGAGMWHTTIKQNSDTSGFRVNAGSGSFYLGDLSLFGEVLNRVDSATDNGLDYHGGNGSQLARVWIEHFKCAWWVGNNGTPTNNLLITGCRFRNLYADAVNFCNGTSNSVIEQTHVRTSGDDAFASWSPSSSGSNNNNIFRFNTVQSPWRANGFAIYGGSNNRIEDNIVSDTSNYPGILIGQEFNSNGFGGTTRVERNSVIRCGGTFGGTNHGALKLNAAQGNLNSIVVNDNDIVDPTFAGMYFAGGNAINCTLSNLTISNAGTYGMRVTSGTGGSAQCDNVVVTAPASGGLRNDGSMNFVNNGGNSGW